MNFSASPESTFTGRLLRFLLRVIPQGTRMPILQGPASGLRWIVGAGNHGCWLGTYEYERSRAFAQSIARDDVVFDIGAHVGYYTLIAAKRAGPDGKIFSFEPLPDNFVLLHKHVAINHLANVNVMEKAVGAQNRRAKFSASTSRYQGRIADDGVLEVEVITLDSLWKADIVPAPTVIKMDVEGAEFDALQGAREMLSATHATIFLSTHGDEVRRQCYDLLESLTYHVMVDSNDSAEFVAMA